MRDSVKYRVILFFAAILISGFQKPERKETSLEYQVKAAFLFNFTQFVEWPAAAFQGETTPFVIGLLGEDRFGSYLDETIQGEKVNGHPLLIRRFKDESEIKDCHILFVAEDKTINLKKLFTELSSRKILTVGDATDFARQGGMIRFFTENNKIRIRINLDATKAADLTVSSKLLRLAEIVGSQNN